MDGHHTKPGPAPESVAGGLEALRAEGAKMSDQVQDGLDRITFHLGNLLHQIRSEDEKERTARAEALVRTLEGRINDRYLLDGRFLRALAISAFLFAGIGFALGIYTLSQQHEITPAPIAYDANGHRMCGVDPKIKQYICILLPYKYAFHIRRMPK